MKKLKVEITEMFMGKADIYRCFFGCIKRLRDDNDVPFVFSRLVMKINKGLLCASAPEQQELAKNLDEMCIMICDKGIHDDKGKSKEIFGSKFFLN